MEKVRGIAVNQTNLDRIKTKGQAIVFFLDPEDGVILWVRGARNLELGPISKIGMDYIEIRNRNGDVSRPRPNEVWIMDPALETKYLIKSKPVIRSMWGMPYYNDPTSPTGFRRPSWALCGHETKAATCCLNRVKPGEYCRWHR
jgi:hypothetical protein